MLEIVFFCLTLLSLFALSIVSLIRRREKITETSAKVRYSGVLLSLAAFGLVAAVFTEYHLFGLLVVVPIGAAFWSAVAVYGASHILAVLLEQK